MTNGWRTILWPKNLRTTRTSRNLFHDWLAPVEELEAIRKVLNDPEAVVLTGLAAVEESIKSASKPANWGNVAMCTSPSTDCLDRKMAFSRGWPSAWAERGRGCHVATRRSGGLAAQRHLVALSACESGIGRLHEGEGIRGLAQAFLQAGSRGVLCSLWRVPDAPTASLMGETYASLKAGTPTSAAIRSAQKKAIDDGQPPLYWASFILIGE